MKAELLSLPASGGGFAVSEYVGADIAAFCNADPEVMMEPWLAELLASRLPSGAKIDNKEYAEVIRRLLLANMAELTAESSPHPLGMFAVWKEVDRIQRLIIDGRPVNEYFTSPPYEFTCGEDLSRMQVKLGYLLEAAKCDLCDFFHCCEATDALRKYFGLKGIPAALLRDIGIDVPADRVDSRGMTFPRLTTLPMGFGPSPGIAQSAHECILYGSAGSGSTRARQLEPVVRPEARWSGQRVPDVDSPHAEAPHALIIDDLLMFRQVPQRPCDTRDNSGDASGLGTAGYAAPSPYRTAAGLGPAGFAAPSPDNDAAGPGTAGNAAPSPDRTAAGLGPAGFAAPSPNIGAAGLGTAGDAAPSLDRTTAGLGLAGYAAPSPNLGAAWLGTAGKAAPSPGRTAAGLGPAGYAAPSPPVVRACSRLLPEELPRALEALDVSGMLAAVRRGRTSARCGLFCVRKEWCPQRRVWMLRLILDRRPRNAEERQVQAEEDTMPHGCVFCEIILEHDEEVRLWLSDLPQWYYRMKVSAERAATNVFTKVLDGDAHRGLAAVQALLASEGRAADDDAPVGPVQFALGTLAMGDVNATVFAQSAHVELLRRFGAMHESEMMVYRGLPPRGKTWEGVVIDDHAIAAVTRRGAPSATPATRRARELFSAGRAAYESIGIEDVAEKRQQGQLDAVAWGCEVQGRRGRAGSRRAKRAALAALTLDLVMIGCTTVELLQSIVGLWSDVLLYRREAFAVFSAVYHFLERYKDDSPRVVRVLPGVVRNDLLGVVCLAPLLDYPLRSSVAPVLHVSDASLDGAAAVEADIPPLVARELWRRRIRAGTRAAALGTPGNRKGDSFVGEIVEGLPMRTRLQFIFRGAERKARNINAGEIRGRKALWRDIANNATEHRRRHLVVYDSASTVGASSKGRSPAIAMMKELRLTYPLILAADCAEGALWCESEMNAADHGSRGRKLAMPAPRRAWVHDFFTGDVDALDRRIRCSEPTGASTPDWRADHDAKEFDATLGYPGEGPAELEPRAAGRNQRARASVDLRVRAQGAGSRPQDLERLRVRFGVWLAAGGHPNLAALSADPVRLDGLLADYGQCLWSSDES